MIVLSSRDFTPEEIKQTGHYVTLQYLNRRGLADIPEDTLNKVQVMLADGNFLNEESLGMMKSLKWVQLTSDGYDGIDVGAALKKGIQISYANGVYGIPIAEDVFSKILMFTRKTRFFLDRMQEKKWHRLTDFSEMYGRHIMIIGTGDIGSEVAVRAKAFGMNISGYNRSGKNPGAFDKIVNTRSGLIKLISLCDFLVVAAPLTRDTYHLLDEDIISYLPSRCVVINVARGKLIDEASLVKALKNGKIAAAGLDVFEKEPLEENSPLWELDNVYITPHNSGMGENCEKRLKELFLFNLRYYPDYTKMKHMIKQEDI